MQKHKRTFNNLLTHRVLPELILPNLDQFYESILYYPDSMQQFLQFAVRHAAKLSMDDPEIEPPYEIETFEMGLEGTIERGVIWVRIPNCKELLDCSVIAFPSTREHAGYFTCEYSYNQFEDSDNRPSYFIFGGWKVEGGCFQHFSWEKSDTEYGEDFVERVHETAYLSVNGKVYFLRGKDYFEAGNYAEAIADFDKAIELELEPNKVPYLFRGIAHNSIGNYTQAIADFDKVIQLDVNQVAAYYFRGVAYCNIGNYALTIADCDKAIELEPNFREAHNQRKFAVDELKKTQSNI